MIGLRSKVSFVDVAYRQSLLFYNLTKTQCKQWKHFSAVSSPIADVELSYTTYPDHEHTVDVKKTPLIFLHGLFGAKGNLHSVSKHLASDGRKVITYDARNHGDSQHTPELNYDCMADDLEGLIKDLKLTNVAVMGHSMGGKTAMTLALTKPETMNALIVVDVAPGKSPGVEELRKYGEAMKNVKIPPGTSIVNARKLAGVQLSPVITNRAVLQFLLTNLREFENGEIKWRMNLDAFLNNYDFIHMFPQEEAQPFTKPTLFIFGSKSLHYKSEGVDRIPKLFPNADITSIKDAGHFVHAEKPIEFVNVVRTFLDSLDEKPS
ncbi:protein ABHD11-like [Physella acuta]|uniref:protein ABHD11-like n=1 Tax=Physella acuta TaxID=109671 RepID=UPI0027DB9DF1|nr:protein ABHD11-like [Physella acuta]